MWITNEHSISKLIETFKSSNDQPFIILTKSSKGGQVVTIDQLIDIGGNHSVVKPTEKDINFKVDAALILFSSGTTGLPKGVLMTHTNYVVSRRLLQYTNKF